MSNRVHGFVDPDFVAVIDALRKVVESRRHRGVAAGGAAVAVYHHGRLVADAWTGVRNAEGDPWERDTIAMSFSTTKGVVSTTLHRLADRGLIDYDTPICEYWPEFAAAGKSRITVRHLLSHQSAMHRIRGLVDRPEQLLDWGYMTGVLAAAPAAWEPGVRPGYHAITYGWLAGELVRRVGGYATVTDAIQAEVAAPIGADGMFVGAPASERPRVAQLLGVAPSTTSIGRMMNRLDGRPAFQPMIDAFDSPGFDELAMTERILDGEIPAANGTFTARSLARMYAGLVSPEAFDGPPLLSPRTVARMTEIQTRERDAVVGVRMKWRLGYHLTASLRGEIPTGFGHFGYGGSGAWGDPVSGLAVAFVVNRVAGTPFADARFLRVGTAAVSAAARLR